MSLDRESFSRIIYLADKHRIRIPNSLVPYVEFGTAINQISLHGLQNAILRYDLPREQFSSFHESGMYTTSQKVVDTGSPEEFRLLVGRTILDAMDIAKANGEIEFHDFISLTRATTDFITSSGNEMFSSSETSLADVDESTGFEKWNSGFEPMDLLFGGLYQGIFTLLGKPGQGKTSIAWAIAEALRANNSATSIWYHSVEIPEKMMVWKTAPSRQRVQFLEDDRLFCGEWSMAEFLDRIARDPDPNRVIIVDGPDAMTAGAGEGRRFAVENIYRDLLTIKQNCKMVIATSQIRRNDDSPTLESGAESWQKAWYSDAMLGVVKGGDAGQGFSQVRFNSVKNRFGAEGRSLSFYFNYATMEWNLPDTMRRAADSWGDSGEW